ncbi:CAP domain-containing protein [uncultured Sulfitobacter sp.]|uniref:CAP domain-containing protein n=1 Tax=uncultured Sulfitobacter sp. TaxID=191468 RepID=UPI00261F89A9|nr:CAP domain-containing protein [uncultured Sulfitobacter sp.]
MPLTAAEQMMLELTNRARLDPLGEAARFGINLNEGLASGTINGSAKQVVAHNEILHSSAEDHSQWMLNTDNFTHQYSNGTPSGSTPGTRASDSGYVQTGYLGENIAVSGTTGTPNLNTMIVDQHEGLFLSKGHRKNILAEHYEELGIGQRAGSFTFSSGPFNSSMVTQVFAESAPNVFLSGVIHNDSDNNKFYSIGEGISGYAVSGGGVSTTSANAGGYTMALNAGTSNVTVTLGSGGAAMQVQANLSQGSGKIDVVDGDMIRSSVNLTLMTGVEKATLLGVANLNMTGMVTDDRLEGNKGNNVLTGRAGDDVLFGGAGNDMLRGGTGADSLMGGAGSDTAGYQSSSSWVNVSLESGYTGGGANNQATGDTFASIEHLDGSAHHDRLSGNDVANKLSGLDGNDILRGRGGNDTIDGGAGSDTADYADSSSWVNVSLATGYTGGGTNNDASGDTFSSIENLTGSRFGDRLSGDSADNVLSGGNGNDILRGRAGDDTLNGGAGSDTADYADSSAWVNISLGSGYTGGGTNNDASGDTFSSIENLTGSRFGDRLSGDSAANVLNGAGGDDILRGRSGGDTLNGGSGSDTADYTDSGTWVNVSLATGFTGGGANNHAIGDRFFSIENLHGSVHGDRLNGSHGNNVIDGGRGNDVLQGYRGIDTFVFDDNFGNDRILDFANGTERLDFSKHSAVTQLSDLTISTSGSSAVVADGSGNSVTLNNMAGLLEGSDFLF